MDRRALLANLGAASCFALPFQAKAQYLKKKVKITDVENVNHTTGLVCGGLPAGGDSGVVSGSGANNASINAIGSHAQDFAPPACMSGLTLGGFVTFTAFLAFLIAPVFQVVGIGTQISVALARLERTREVMHEPAFAAASWLAMIRSLLRTTIFRSSCSTITVLPTCSGGTE